MQSSVTGPIRYFISSLLCLCYLISAVRDDDVSSRLEAADADNILSVQARGQVARHQHAASERPDPPSDTAESDSPFKAVLEEMEKLKKESTTMGTDDGTELAKFYKEFQALKEKQKAMHEKSNVYAKAVNELYNAYLGWRQGRIAAMKKIQEKEGEQTADQHKEAQEGKEALNEATEQNRISAETEAKKRLGSA